MRAIASSASWCDCHTLTDGSILSPELRAHRLRQNNLVGPAGYVSMEDGAVGGFVQRGIAAAEDELSIIEMGGAGAETQETRATEASVRGFWKAYRRYMGY